MTPVIGQWVRRTYDDGDPETADPDNTRWHLCESAIAGAASQAVARSGRARPGQAWHGN